MGRIHKKSMVDAVAAGMLLLNHGEAHRTNGSRRLLVNDETDLTVDDGPLDATNEAMVPASDSDADSGDDTIAPPVEDDSSSSTLSTLPAASQLHHLFQTYTSTFTLERIRFDKLNVEDAAKATTTPRVVPVPGKATDVVDVVEGLNACLTSLVRELFKESVITTEMKNALKRVVEPRARNAQLKPLSLKVRHALAVFYERLLSSIAVLQIACEKEDREATRDITSTRRPNLRLWEAVTADLTSLQCVFKKGARLGYLELSDGAIEPTSAIGMRNKQIARTLKNIRTQERELIKLRERQADHDEELQKLEHKYMDVNPQIQRANANIGFLHTKLQSFTDIPLIVAETIAAMQAPQEPVKSS